MGIGRREGRNGRGSVSDGTRREPHCGNGSLALVSYLLVSRRLERNRKALGNKEFVATLGECWIASKGACKYDQGFEYRLVLGMLGDAPKHEPCDLVKVGECLKKRPLEKRMI